VKVRLPPRDMKRRLLPEDAPHFRDDRYTDYVMRWQVELDGIRTKVNPKRYLTLWGYFGDERVESWNEFLSACVLYDPPEDWLLDFASYEVQMPTFLADDGVLEEALRELPEMVDPPIKTLWELMETGDWFWARIIHHVGERYLEPRGLDTEDLLQAVFSEVPGLREEYLEKQERYSRRYYIEVDEYTTREDVENAFQMIRAVQPSKRSKLPRDQLTAVRCAILYDWHNQREPEDRRERRWAYEKLAKRLHLSDPRAAKDHVALGREILDGRASTKDR
jgi:hypothetical protein